MSLLSAFLVYFSGKFQFAYLTLFHVTFGHAAGQSRVCKNYKGAMINKKQPQ